jgi:hypothetical protein
MTLLSHFSDPLHASRRSLRAYRHADLLAAGALAGIIALKTAIYLSHLNY